MKRDLKNDIEQIIQIMRVGIISQDDKIPT